MSLCERPLIKLSMAEEGARDGEEPSIRPSRFLLSLSLWSRKGLSSEYRSVLAEWVTGGVLCGGQVRVLGSFGLLPELEMPCIGLHQNENA